MGLVDFLRSTYNPLRFISSRRQIDRKGSACRSCRSETVVQITPPPCRASSVGLRGADSFHTVDSRMRSQCAKRTVVRMPGQWIVIVLDSESRLLIIWDDWAATRFLQSGDSEAHASPWLDSAPSCAFATSAVQHGHGIADARPG